MSGQQTQQGTSGYYQPKGSPPTGYQQPPSPHPPAIAVDPMYYAYAQYQQAASQEYASSAASAAGQYYPPEAYAQYEGATYYLATPAGYSPYHREYHHYAPPPPPPPPVPPPSQQAPPRYTGTTNRHPQQHHHHPYPSPYPGYHHGGNYQQHHSRPRPAYGATFGHIDPQTGHDYRRLDDGGKQIDEARVHNILAKRLQLKMNRNFTEADRLRDELSAMGVMVHDREKTWEVRRTPCGESASSSSNNPPKSPRPSPISNDFSTGPSTDVSNKNMSTAIDTPLVDNSTIPAPTHHSHTTQTNDATQSPSIPKNPPPISPSSSIPQTTTAEITTPSSSTMNSGDKNKLDNDPSLQRPAASS